MRKLKFYKFSAIQMLTLVVLCLLVFSVFVFKSVTINSIVKGVESKFGLVIQNKPINTPVPILSPSPSPTPRPLTFSELNQLYGPCVHLPILFYHHIQSEAAASASKQQGLTVYTDVFQKQMQYLKTRGYNVASMGDLVNFFDNGVSIPGRSILLTFDDGYQDFYTDAYPILQSFGFRSTMFVPTGLMENPGYLTWGEISGMNNGLVLFANHTWSHADVAVSTVKMKTEISTADNQLLERGLNVPKVFAYPYGIDSGQAEGYLASIGYKAAFTTIPGNILCKKQRFTLPRIRVGNSSLSSYGF